MPLPDDDIPGGGCCPCGYVVGVQLHHPRFLEHIGALESARLLGRWAEWLQVMNRQDVLDAGLIVFNPTVLSHYVTSLHRMSMEVIIGNYSPHNQATMLCWCKMFIALPPRWQPWAYGVHRFAQEIPGWILLSMVSTARAVPSALAGVQLNILNRFTRTATGTTLNFT